MSSNATWNTSPAEVGPASSSSSSLWMAKNTGMQSSRAGTASIFTNAPTGKKQISKAAVMALFGRGSNKGPFVVPPGVTTPGKTTYSVSHSMSISALANVMQRESNSNIIPNKSTAAPFDGGMDGNILSTGNGTMNATFGIVNGGAVLTTPTKLRKETLMSLGISTRPRTPKSCMKKSGSSSDDGMRRSATLSSIHEIDVVLPGSRSIRRNTSITFRDTVMVKRVPSSSSLVENPCDLWVQPDEQRQIRQSAKALVQVVDESDVDPGLIDIRGLEGHTRYVRKRVQARKHDTWDAVLDAQDFQRHTGDYNDEQIASLVRSMSRESLAEAQSRAQRDAIEAHNGYRQ